MSPTSHGTHNNEQTYYIPDFYTQYPQYEHQIQWRAYGENTIGTISETFLRPTRPPLESAAAGRNPIGKNTEETLHHNTHALKMCQN